MCAQHKQATKAAQLRFYETLRSELGSEVGVTILTAGFVESEMTKGKVIQKDGQVAIDLEARDVSCKKKKLREPGTCIYIYVVCMQVQIGVFPVARVEKLCEVALDGHPERGLVRDMAVAVPAGTARRLPRPRGPQLSVPRAVQRQRRGAAAEPEDAGRHRSQALLPAVVAPASSGHQGGGGDSSQKGLITSVQ